MQQQFLFALKVSDHPGFDALLGDLAECVLRQVGYSPQAIEELLAKLREAVAAAGTDGRRGGDIQFRTESDQLLIVVSSAGGRERRVAHALPD